MSEHYNHNYNREQVDDILQRIKDCVNNNDFTIEINKNRQENTQFIYDYNINYSKQKMILLDIKTTDFCHSLQNTNIGFEYETLYVFCPQCTLSDLHGKEEIVDIYIKFNIIAYKDNKRVVTISFHKRNKPMNYLFR